MDENGHDLEEDANKQPEGDCLSSSNDQLSGKSRQIKIKNEDKTIKSWSSFLIEFGNNVRLARLKAGLKQSDLAKETSMTQQYISHIEAGEKNVSIITAANLASAMNIEIKDLMNIRIYR